MYRSSWIVVREKIPYRMDGSMHYAPRQRLRVKIKVSSSLAPCLKLLGVGSLVKRGKDNADAETEEDR